MQVHGSQCLRCTYSTVKKVSAKQSCCTAVRDRKAYAIQRCQVGEVSPELYILFCQITPASASGPSLHRW